MSLRRAFLFGSLMAWAVVAGRAESAPRGAIVFAEVGAWDISDDGLPYRLGAILPSRHDPLSRLLRMREPRWVVAVGYAKIPAVYDDGTGRLSGAGGDGFLIAAAREWAWALPLLGTARCDAALAIDFGLSYATRSLPANGTHPNFLVSPGFVWETRSAAGRPGWHFGLRWFHLSNADLFGRNAGYDGITLRIGRGW